MYVGLGFAQSKIGIIKMRQRIAGPKSKKRSLRFLVIARMAHGTYVELPLAAEGFDGGDIPAFFYSRVFLLKFYMVQCRPVASLAIYSVHNGIAVQVFAHRQ